MLPQLRYISLHPNPFLIPSTKDTDSYGVISWTKKWSRVVSLQELCLREIQKRPFKIDDIVEFPDHLWDALHSQDSCVLCGQWMKEWLCEVTYWCTRIANRVKWKQSAPFVLRICSWNCARIFLFRAAG